MGTTVPKYSNAVLASERGLTHIAATAGSVSLFSWGGFHFVPFVLSLSLCPKGLEKFNFPFSGPPTINGQGLGVGYGLFSIL